ncbi:MAG TPA: GNAT family protein [Alphaproteobacteria bacterium]|nr:GNAT family protein [Alphaproteobacteria bacterium]
MKVTEALKGKSLSLAAIDESHATETYALWLNDKDVGRYMETRHKRWTTESIKGFINEQNASSDQMLFGIFQENGAHIGNIKLGPINIIHKNAQISLFIGDKNAWGKGYATEAISLVRDYAFQKLHLQKLTAGMYSANQGSYRAFLAAGFKLEGTLKSHCLDADGKRTDVLQVGLASA